MRDKYNGLYDYEAKIMPEKSNIDITIGYENYLNVASYKVSDFDTVVSENEHLGEENVSCEKFVNLLPKTESIV